MKKSNKNNNLIELLEKLKNWTSPILVRLSNREDNDFLIDSIVTKVKQKKTYEVEYKKLDSVISEEIKQELHIIKNPALLLIQEGEIKAIFSGIVSQFQLENAIQELLTIN